MKILLTLLLFCSLSIAQAETIKFDNHTVDIFTKSSPSPTILYIPGCNGLDEFGKKYQKFHREEFAKVFPNANFVIVQLTNDITKGAENGLCHWDPRSDERLKDYQSFHQAKYIVNLGDFIKQQSWSNGEIHVFGFSYGGHTGLWLNGTTIGKPNLFKSVSLIWPFCKMPIRNHQFGNIHTPTRIWATEKDPLSDAWNCHRYYSGNKDLLTLTLYEGGNHCWFTHPSINGVSIYWPVWRVQVFHKFDRALFDKTMTDWKIWIDGLESVK
jgi:dienelactone hydrolase